MHVSNKSFSRLWLLLAALIATCVIYWPGLSGGWLFDDYPNIVENKHVQVTAWDLPSLTGAVLSSPASEFKRPLASLSFALNYLSAGLAPFAWKLTNLGIHLLNGLLVFLLMRLLLRALPGPSGEPSTRTGYNTDRANLVAVLIAAGWLVLPINLTAVLYVVQRMESLANLFVLLGLLGYVAMRRRMQQRRHAGDFILAAASITVPAALGLLAKETAVMLPLYALLVEAVIFRFRTCKPPAPDTVSEPLRTTVRDIRLLLLFLLVLVIPAVLGLAWLLPVLLKPDAWVSRDFDMRTRLLSEARIVAGYVGWSVFPRAHALSFYHDDFRISTGWLSPWTTLASTLFLAALAALGVWLRRRRPFIALGIALFLGCHLLTGTILSLELIYEHRNYFASLGLVMALACWLVPTSTTTAQDAAAERRALTRDGIGIAVLAAFVLFWSGTTAVTAYAWGDDLRLAQALAARAPESPRAQYELGRAYIIKSHNDPSSPYTQRAYAPLERAAALPESSILPQQALIFMNANMHLPLKDAWWDSMIAKLKAHPPGVQDESSLAVLTSCARSEHCDLPHARMRQAFVAGLSHPAPSARLLATYSDYAWNVLDDHALGLRMIDRAVVAAPYEPAYRITQIRMLVAAGDGARAHDAYEQLKTLNTGGRLDGSLDDLRRQLSSLSS